MAVQTQAGPVLVTTTNKRRIPPKQLGGVESPATLILQPVIFDQRCSWWTRDNILVAGIRVQAVPELGPDRHDWQMQPQLSSSIGYQPVLVPRHWEEHEFGVVVEYEATKGARFQLKLYYGCGDPDSLHILQSDSLVGHEGERHRAQFDLDECKLTRGELLRCTLEVLRFSPHPVVVYGAWLEVGVDATTQRAL